MSHCSLYLQVSVQCSKYTATFLTLAAFVEKWTMQVAAHADPAAAGGPDQPLQAEDPGVLDKAGSPEVSSPSAGSNANLIDRKAAGQANASKSQHDTKLSANNSSSSHNLDGSPAQAVVLAKGQPASAAPRTTKHASRTLSRSETASELLADRHASPHPSLRNSSNASSQNQPSLAGAQAVATGQSSNPMLQRDHNLPSGDQSQATGRQSPKPTLLRDQHLPGETLHRKTAFPADIHTRHEAACANPLAAQQQHAATGNGTDLAQSVGFAELCRQADTSLRQMNPPNMHGQDAMQRKPHPVQQQPASNKSASSPSGVQARAACTMPNPHAVRSIAVHSNSLSIHGPSNSAEPAHGEPATGSSSVHDASALAQAAFSRTANGRLEGNKPARVQSLALEPCFEATTPDLARNKSWATEWLAMGMQEDQPCSSESAALLQTSAGLHPKLQQTEHKQSAEQELQHSDMQTLMQQSRQLSSQTTVQGQHSNRQTRTLTIGQQHGTALTRQSELSPAGTSCSSQLCRFGPLNEAKVPQSCSIPLGKETAQDRPWTVPTSNLLKEAGLAWVQDVERLRSARPGSGGSPTARYCYCPLPLNSLTGTPISQAGTRKRLYC